MHSPTEADPERNKKAWWSYLITRRDMPAALDPCIKAIAQKGCGRVSPSIYVRWDERRQLAWLERTLSLDAATAVAFRTAAAKPAKTRVRRASACPRPGSEGGGRPVLEAGLPGGSRSLEGLRPVRWVVCSTVARDDGTVSAPYAGGNGSGVVTELTLAPSREVLSAFLESHPADHAIWCDSTAALTAASRRTLPTDGTEQLRKAAKRSVDASPASVSGGSGASTKSISQVSLPQGSRPNSLPRASSPDCLHSQCPLRRWQRQRSGD
jgi:hypothetical protein